MSAPVFHFMRALFLFALFAGCSSQGTFGYRSPGPYYGGPLLGDGTYVQDIRVEPSKGEPYTFRTIFGRRGNSLFLEAISAGGKRAWIAKDTLVPADRPVLEIFPSDMLASKEELEAIYNCLRPLFLLNDKPTLPQPLVRERYHDSRPRVLSGTEMHELLIDEFDWNGHAWKIRLKLPGASGKATMREFKREEE